MHRKQIGRHDLPRRKNMCKNPHKVHHTHYKEKGTNKRDFRRYDSSKIQAIEAFPAFRYWRVAQNGVSGKAKKTFYANNSGRQLSAARYRCLSLRFCLKVGAAKHRLLK